jgi:hypothetical protein
MLPVAVVEHDQYWQYDIEERIYTKSKAGGVLISKGSWFRVAASSGPALQFRLTYAAAPVEDLALAVNRFGDAMRTVVTSMNSTTAQFKPRKGSGSIKKECSDKFNQNAGSKSGKPLVP